METNRKRKTYIREKVGVGIRQFLLRFDGRGSHRVVAVLLHIKVEHGWFDSTQVLSKQVDLLQSQTVHGYVLEKNEK